MSVELLVVGLVEAGGVDAEVFEYAFSNRTVVVRALDGLRASVAEQHTIAGAELVALGVTAEIVVIIEDEHSRVGTGLSAIKVGGGESADAAPDDNQVVGLG